MFIPQHYDAFSRTFESLTKYAPQRKLVIDMQKNSNLFDLLVALGSYCVTPADVRRMFARIRYEHCPLTVLELLVAITNRKTTPRFVADLPNHVGISGKPW